MFWTWDADESSIYSNLLPFRVDETTLLAGKNKWLGVFTTAGDAIIDLSIAFFLAFSLFKRRTRFPT
jgi:hypothetical protein